MSQQIVHDLLTTPLTPPRRSASTQLPALADRLHGRVDPGLAIGCWGQLKEWKIEHLATTPGTSTATSPTCSPSTRATPLTRATPELAAAARSRSRPAATAAPAGPRPGRSTSGHACWTATAHKSSATSGPPPSPTCGTCHPPFQIDGNFGATAGIAEMLPAEPTGGIDVLPALPSAWAEGGLEGMVARGGAKVSANWGGGTTQSGCSCQGRPAHRAQRSLRRRLQGRRRDHGNHVAAQALEPGLVSFTAEAGHEYDLTRSGSVSLDCPPRQPGAGIRSRRLSAHSAHSFPGALRLNLPRAGLSPQASRPPLCPRRHRREKGIHRLVTGGRARGFGLTAILARAEPHERQGNISVLAPHCWTAGPCQSWGSAARRPTGTVRRRIWSTATRNPAGYPMERKLDASAALGRH